MIEATSSAVSHIRQMLTDQNRQDWGVRVGVKGGGCSGLTYTMDFEPKPGEHDRVFDVEGIRIFCDPKSYLYLNGLTLDFSSQLMGGGFKFLNPNAQRSCSCGTSFST